MRVFLTAAILLLIGEAIIGLAFLAGYHWWGGALRGLLVAAVAAIIMIAPWIGDLVIDFDSASGKGVIRLSWWGKVMLQVSAPPSARICLLGICIKRVTRRPEKPPRPKRAVKSQRMLRRRMWRWLRRSLRDLVPPVLAGSHLAHVFLWEAREIELTTQSPTQFSLADQMIAKIIGSPRLGGSAPRRLQPGREGKAAAKPQPGTLQLRFLYPRKRRIVFHYRIGLFRISAAAAVALAQARPLRALRAMKEARRRWEASTVTVAPNTPAE